MLKEFWHNFRHNLFKPLLLFFYLGFLVPILRVQFEFPYVMYQALTIYLLIAIGWHGGEELAHLNPDSIKSIVGFMGVGFLANTLMGLLAFGLLRTFTRMRRIDQATVAGYYGSDSAGTFVTTLGVLGTAHVAFDAYMPVMLAIMEIPGCLVALFLVSRYRAQGMDALGNMPDEPGYDPDARPIAPPVDEHGQVVHASAVQEETELSLERMEHGDANGGNGRKKGFLDGKLLHEVFLNTGLYLLFGGIVIGFISGLQGPEVTRADDSFFVSLFQGVLCLFLLEMGMTASRKLRDLKTAGWNFVAFGLLAPNLFATLGILIVHTYAWLTGSDFQLGTYVLFSVLCGSASYIAVPAVQRLAIPEASPTLPLAASLGLTFSYNVTIGIPIYMEIAKAVMRDFPIG
ncbi:sodium-dependent bicarbonate transport family permease [Paludisphaera soli]|uniref:sodium-dependent bicarbonate transport family permease n=1 Tax=Paludisphaera soli TaxID=2712865 RepID=UPI0013EBDEF0